MDPVAPADPVEVDLEAGVLREIEQFLRELRGSRALAAIEPDALLERDLGLGSLERVELASRLERRFDAKVADSALAEAQTPRALCRALLASDSELPSGHVSAGFQPSRLAPPTSARSLTEVLVRRAQAEPDAPHLFLREDDAAERTVLVSELYSEAMTVCGGLQSSGVRRGDRVAILLGTSRDFFSSFMGILLAGAVPVPLYPPISMARLEEYIARQAGIVDNSEASLFITLERGVAVGEILKTRAPALREVVTVSDLVARSQPIEPVHVGGDEPALIQYTSGSTGNPKGVLLSHANLLANIRAIGETLSIRPTDVGVSWLPLYHDMGLIGAWLTPLYFGIPVAIFSPLAFLARPQRWLWTLHAHRGTISPAPNFAYERCARKIEDSELEGLDLSAWRVALNGAEPVASDTVERFTRKFSPYGFDAESFLPVYGLAESSLLVAAPRRREKPRVSSFDRDALETRGIARPPTSGSRVRRLVCVGEAVPGHDVRVVDELGRQAGEGVEGAVLFRGPSSMQGYFRNESATAAIRRDEGFLDSGDRGFFVEGGLYITGRSKDIIIRAGRNLMPQEIEAAAAQVAGVRAGGVAAFGVGGIGVEHGGTESLVVVAETNETEQDAVSQLHRAIHSSVVDAVGAPPDEVVLVPARSIPKTSSGKLRRAACRELYLQGRIGSQSSPSRLWWARTGYRFAVSRLERLFRKTGRLVFGGYVGGLTMGFLAVGFAVAVLVPSRGFFQRFVRAAARSYLTLTGMRLEVEGAARLESETGPFVFAANHASYLDPIPILATLPMDFAFVVKREAATWPLIGTFIRRLGYLPVERVHAAESAAGTMEELLNEGRSIVVFPEGTFTYASGVRPFKLGAFQLAVASGRPLVPVALIGTRHWLRDGTFVPRRGVLKVVIGEPSMATSDTFAEIVRLKEETATRIAESVGEPRLDLVAAGPVKP